MTGLMNEIAAVVVLLCLLVVVIVKPRRIPEGLAGFAGALLLVAIGATTATAAVSQIGELMPTALFLGTCLILAGLCEREGLFSYLGRVTVRLSHGNPSRLFLLSFLMCAIVTAALSLDTTVLLLTPVILHMTNRARADFRPYVYAACHLANTASLLLPVSNLTNLLAMNSSGLDFLAFARTMFLPWCAAIAVEYIVMRIAFRFSFSDEVLLEGRAKRDEDSTGEDSKENVPIFALCVVIASLGGFMVSSSLGAPPFWVALLACMVLLVHRVIREGAVLGKEFRRISKDSNLSFLVFVLSLAVVVSALSGNGLGSLLSPLFSGEATLVKLLVVAGCSALAANLLNNLPAAMLLIPLAASSGSTMVMAVLIGVNIGPNLTYAGSLATILWRRIVHNHGKRITLARFTGIGLVSVPLCIFFATLSLWLVTLH
ncbi:SLC13 family permease [Bifidobacterium psychraerophilum]|uniref:Arsenical pump membrane protein n=2 Tax=Bifidobacterium psychraerophilum TaxID=218140 RepID=A0A087CE85_9BIFI|nr:SLC13 family permease [Bifidobacterium psychraerophilum]KFI81585.1 Arsenical pump membrane protein [Bifidobacterium psychraerophilum]